VAVASEAMIEATRDCGSALGINREIVEVWAKESVAVARPKILIIVECIVTLDISISCYVILNERVKKNGKSVKRAKRM
jgi:hypothetical protein